MTDHLALVRQQRDAARARAANWEQVHREAIEQRDKARAELAQTERLRRERDHYAEAHAAELLRVEQAERERDELREAVLAIADEYAAAAQWRETPEPGDDPADVHVAHTVRVIESDLRAMVTRLDRPDATTLRERLLAACGDKERLAAINASQPKFTTQQIRDLIAEHERAVS